MNPSFKRLLGTVLLIATVGLASVMAARASHAQTANILTPALMEYGDHG